MNTNKRKIELENEMSIKYKKENQSFYEQFIEVIYVDDVGDRNKNESDKLIDENDQKSKSNNGPHTIEYCAESENKTKSLYSFNNLVGKVRVRDISMMIEHNLPLEKYNDIFCLKI